MKMKEVTPELVLSLGINRAEHFAYFLSRVINYKILDCVTEAKKRSCNGVRPVLD